mmetsp:Transcript_2390/g.8084  ORF Transcript_2390/g.8084 Transcript_2390/m.8084 type:complete len:414 (-) Transcript_2390:824-2065(-)
MVAYLSSAVLSFASLRRRYSSSFSSSVFTSSSRVALTRASSPRMGAVSNISTAAPLAASWWAPSASAVNGPLSVVSLSIARTYAAAASSRASRLVVCEMASTIVTLRGSCELVKTETKALMYAGSVCASSARPATALTARSSENTLCTYSSNIRRNAASSPSTEPSYFGRVSALPGCGSRKHLTLSNAPCTASRACTPSSKSLDRMRCSSSSISARHLATSSSSSKCCQSRTSISSVWNGRGVVRADAPPSPSLPSAAARCSARWNSRTATRANSVKKCRFSSCFSSTWRTTLYTWCEESSVESAKMEAVVSALTALSKRPCVSISSTATSSPPRTRSTNGRPYIQMPVVARSEPPRHRKPRSEPSLPAMPSIARRPACVSHDDGAAAAAAPSPSPAAAPASSRFTRASEKRR